MEPTPFLPGRLISPADLTQALQDKGFTTDGLARLQLRYESEHDQNEGLLRRLEADSPLRTLILLFLLNRACEPEAVGKALAPVPWGELIESGLLRIGPDGVRATARLLPWRHCYLLHDYLPSAGPLPDDFVMNGLSASSQTLAMLTPRRRVQHALDLGTGAGIHALLMSEHAERVTATDTNSRALNMAAMNARLNGAPPIGFLQGSFFEPVEGQKFDLIVCNPPFLIAPPSNLRCQSAGLHGDSVSELLVRQAPEYLREGGLAVFLVSWYHGEKMPWDARPLSWARDSGCDFLLLRTADDHPHDYAANAVSHLEHPGTPRHKELLDRYIAYYESLGMERLSFGVVYLRKREAPSPWTRSEIVREEIGDGAGDQVARMIEAEDRLAAATVQDMLGWRLVVADHHLLHQTLAMEDREWVGRSLVLEAQQGFRYRVPIDDAMLSLLSRGPGASLGQTLSELAESTGSDPMDMARALLPKICELIRKGMVNALA